MYNYFGIKFYIVLRTVFLLVVIWISYAYFITPQTSRLNAYYVQQRMIQEKLYLIDQTQRPQKFADLINLLKHVDSFRRLEILRGIEMKKWFDKLMFTEKAGIMEEILPQPVIGSIRRFLLQPEEDQIAYLYRAGELLLASNKIPTDVRQQMARYQAAVFQEKRRMIRDEIQKYPADQRYYRILEIVFDKFNGQTIPPNPIEQAQVMILDEIMNDLGRRQKEIKT